MRIGVWIIGAAVLGLHGAAFGQTTIGSAGRWSIVDATETCSMQARLADQTRVEFAVQKSDPNRAHLRLANPNWQSLAQRQRVSVDVLINGQGQALRPVPTFSASGESGIMIPFGRGFMREVFTERATVAVFHQSAELLVIYLNDPATQAAFQVVRQCAGDRYDPFTSR